MHDTMAVPKRQRVKAWLHDVAQETAQAIQRARRTKDPGRYVAMGADGTPTSAIDRAAERIIIQRLDDAPIPLNLVSEEIGHIDRGAEWTVVADPVDGTRNASRGIPFYCVCLGIGRNDLSGMEMGLVHSVPDQRVYWAEQGHGARLDGRRIEARKMHKGEILVGAALDYEKKKLRLPGDARIHFRDLGSAALEMCLVARGGLDGFLSTDPYVRIVDVAASTVVVREAGGHVLGLNQKPLNAPFDVKNRFAMVVLGDLAAWKVLR